MRLTPEQRRWEGRTLFVMVAGSGSLMALGYSPAQTFGRMFLALIVGSIGALIARRVWP